MEIHRYPHFAEVSSPLDPLEDVIGWISGLKSKQYLMDIVKRKHNISGGMKLGERVDHSCACIEIACEYFNQAYCGPQSVSFLPLYYALLNLAKVYILLGNYASEILNQRRHGVSYESMLTKSRDLITERIKIHPKGTVPLFYRSLMGHEPIRRNYCMSDIYPYIVNISAEYNIATRHEHIEHLFISSAITLQERSDNKQRIMAEVFADTPDHLSFIMSNLRVLKVFKKMHQEGNMLVSPNFPKDDANAVNRYINRQLLYIFSKEPGGRGINLVPLFSGWSVLPEEFPILLAFFHLSSVVRYNPRFYQRLADSKYWPVVLALRKHGTLQFLKLFWNFINQTSYCLTHA